MRLNELQLYYNCVKESVLSVFSKSVSLVEENCEQVDPVHRGWFLEKFWYYPQNFKIEFEAEYGEFIIQLVKEENVHVALSQICPYDSSLSIENIKKAVAVLKKEMQKPIVFFKHIINDSGMMEIYVLLGKEERLISWEEYKKMSASDYHQYIQNA